MVQLFDTALHDRQNNEFYSGDNLAQDKFMNDLRAIIAQKPDFLAAYSYLAECLMYRDEHLLAIPILNQAIAQLPNESHFISKRAYCLKVAKQFPEADADYSRLIELYGGMGFSSWNTFVARGTLRIEMKNYKGALQDAHSLYQFSKGEEIAKIGNAESLKTAIMEEVSKLRMDALLGENKAAEAFKLYKQYPSFFNSQARGRDVAVLLINAQLYQDAVVVLNAVINYGSNIDYPLFLRSLAYRELNQLAPALQDLNQYLEIYLQRDPAIFYNRDAALAEAYVYRAELFRLMNRTEEHLADIKSAIQFKHPKADLLQQDLTSFEADLREGLSFSAFAKNYWLCFVWLSFLGLLALVSVLALLEPSMMARAIVAVILLGALRFVQIGARIRPDAWDDNEKMKKIPNIQIYLVSAFNILFWYFIEAWLQISFLHRMWKLWQEGKVMLIWFDGKQINLQGAYTTYETLKTNEKPATQS